MKKYAFETMSFYEGGDGSLTDIVARKSLFKSKEDFLNWLLKDSEEWESYIDSYEVGGEPVILEEDIKESYVRYFKNFGKYSGMDIESGYTFSNKGRGAFEVYHVNFQ